ncbi:hypothetical protein PoB_007409000 [Plakobranchus ocellatus]|uniref:Mitochondria-eating protein n=1 Tax=Plakobranchus ocellatus TaxID=259542 RepID=A0AAV4DUE4_9GAST|nr:hypothetical protein PoB_007409000 [Plakobranchus ocellatus]
MPTISGETYDQYNSNEREFLLKQQLGRRTVGTFTNDHPHTESQALQVQTELTEQAGDWSSDAAPQLAGSRFDSQLIQFFKLSSGRVLSIGQVRVSAMSGDISRTSSPSLTSKDVRSEARNFSASLTNVFLMKRRDPQTKHLLEKAQSLIDALLAETSRPSQSAPQPRPHQRGGGGMGQLWVKLDELKRENDDLKRQRGRSTDEHAGSPKSPKSPRSQTQIGQVETLTSDLQKMKAENELLKTQIEKLQTTIKEHQKISASLQDEAKRSKVALEAAQKTAKKAREDCKKMEASLSSAKSGKEPVKQKPSSPPTSSPGPAPTPPPKPAALTVTSSPKPTPRPRTDNRHTENIGEKCRPSNIAVAFTTLESQEWMDAKESLEDVAEEEPVLKFLCEILMSSYGASSAILKSVENVISHVLSNPTAAVNMMNGVETDRLTALPTELSDLIGQKLRATYDKISTADVAELAQKSSDAAPELTSHLSQPAVRKYALGCGALTWQMVIQKPPMRMSTGDSHFDSERHRLWWSCNHLNQGKDRSINYFIWPCLLDYEGGNLLMKGCVHAN